MNLTTSLTDAVVQKCLEQHFEFVFMVTYSLLYFVNEMHDKYYDIY